MRRRYVVLLVILLVVVVAWIAASSYLAEAPIGSGFIANTMCYGVFVSGRAADEVWANEFAGEAEDLLARFSVDVDTDAKTVRASLYGFASAVAAHREGLGCVLVQDRALADLQSQAIDQPPIDVPADVHWPEGSLVETSDLTEGVDRTKLDAALDAAFAPPETGPNPNTRAVVIVHHGRIIAERAVDPFTVHTPLYGASMSKTVSAMLVGVLVKQGRLSTGQSGLRPEWADDARRGITLDHLLRMSSGLRFTEVYAGTSDVNRMLFEEPDTAAYAASLPLEADPGSKWSYSSGTSNIMMAVARETFGGDEESYRRFPHDALFGPLGCRSAVFQPDASGTFVGSSYVFAAARDWARLGLLLLNDGVWRGERLLPEGWVDYMRTPAPADPKLGYGAQTWLEGARSHDEPAPVYEMRGYGGQMVTMIPEADLVVVRLGWQNQRPGWDNRQFVERIIEAVGLQIPN